MTVSAPPAVQKVCTKCGEVKDLATEFHRKPQNKDGYAGVCRACVSIQQGVWRAANQAGISARKRAWRQKQRDKASGGAGAEGDVT